VNKTNSKGIKVMTWLIVIAFLVVLFSGIFALIEAAIAYVDEIKLKRLLRKDIKNKKHIEEIITKKRHYISAILTMNTIITITGSSYVGIEASTLFGGNTIMSVGFTGLLAYFILVFSKILPKISAINNYEKILVNTALLTKFIKIILSPVFYLTYPWTFLVKTEKNDLSINDLKSVIDYYSEKGVLIEQQSLLMDKVFNIKEKRIEELMTTYTDKLIVLDADSLLGDCKEAILSRQAKRYLISDNDEIVGIAFHRDLSDQLIKKNKELTLRNCMHNAIILHESDMVLESLSKFKKKKNSYAILQDKNDKAIAVLSEKQLYSYAMRD
jgi:CBS domain containing-hemolysin-like protein